MLRIWNKIVCNQTNLSRENTKVLVKHSTWLPQKPAKSSNQKTWHVKMFPDNF